MIPHNRGDHPGHRLRLGRAKDLLEFPQQRGPLLQLGRLLRPPDAAPRTDAPDGEAQEVHRLPLREVHQSTFLFIDLDMEARQLLAEPFVHCVEQPRMAGVGVQQDDQIVGEPGILHRRVLVESGGLFGPFQHPVHLGEVEIAEQRRDHSALRNPHLPGGLQHLLEQGQHVSIVDPPGHLREQQIVPHVIEVGAEVKIDHTGLVLPDGCGHPVHRLVRGLLRPVPTRPRLKVRLKDGLQDALERALDHAVADRGDREDSDLAAIGLRDRLLPAPQGPIRAGDQFVPELLEKHLDAARFDGRERDAVDARRPIVGLCRCVRRAERLQLAHMDGPVPRTARTVRPSPWRRSSAAGLAAR